MGFSRGFLFCFVHTLFNVMICPMNMRHSCWLFFPLPRPPFPKVWVITHWWVTTPCSVDHKPYARLKYGASCSTTVLSWESPKATSGSHQACNPFHYSLWAPNATWKRLLVCRCNFRSFPWGFLRSAEAS